MNAQVLPLERRPRELTPSRISDAAARALLIEIAHDLRSPLSAILMMAEAIRRGQSGPVTADQRRQLTIICRAAHSLCATASDVVELAREDFTPRVPRRTPFSLSTMLDSVRDTVMPLAAGRDVRIHFDLPPNVHRIGHASALGRVLLNLTTNALKHTEHGEVRIEIREIGGDDGLVECAVSDTGRGMTPAVLTAVFTGPCLAAGDTNGLTSAGVGLAICRRLVASMGSTLQASSVDGCGSRFYFTIALPRVSSAA